MPAATFSHYPAIAPAVNVGLRVIPEHACAYFPERIARSRAFWADHIEPEAYQACMDAGFRRSGRVIYQPVCGGCRECIPIRLPVREFSPSRSQRRCWLKNRDLTVTKSLAPTADDEAFDLYQRYLRDWHGGFSGGASGANEDRESFASFLYDSPTDTMEFRYRDATGRLLAVGICDIGPGALSSVYFYFDPSEAKRGLGTFGALVELDFARQHEIEHYYLGYWIERCGAMSYKSAYRPFELLGGDGAWRRGTRIGI